MRKTLPIIAFVALVAGIALVRIMRSGKQAPSPAVTTAQKEVIEPRPIEIPDDAIWFDLEYRGLTCKEGEMRYGFSIGYGRPGDVKDSPFIKSVRKRTDKDIHVVYNGGFGDRALSAVETEGREVTLFYFDCDGNHKLSDGEIFKPINVKEYSSHKEWDFVTSDFVLTNGQGRAVPFRAKLTASFFGDQERPQAMWSPACILEGTAQINEQKTRLLLFAGGLDGDFVEYGRASYALLTSEDETEYPPRATLSSLIFYEGKFYQLRFDGAFEQGKKLRAVLVADTSPTGELAVGLRGRKTLSTRVDYATVKGKTDKSIHFQIRETQRFPVDEYVLERGQFTFGQHEDYDWTVSFAQGPDFPIRQDDTSTLELGKPEMTVSSVDENKRYNPNVEDLDTFTSENRIYLSPKIVGIRSEAYLRVQKRDDSQTRRFNDVRPHLTIRNAAGQEMISQDLEYG